MRSMLDVIDAVIIGTMWVIVLIRSMAIRHTQTHLLMWLALTTGVISVTIDQTRLAHWITHVSGNPGLALLLDTIFTIAALTWVNTFYIAAASSGGNARQRRRQWYPWCVALPVMISLGVITLSQRLELHSTYTAVGNHQATSAQTGVIVLYEVYVLSSLTMMTSLFVILSRRERNPWLLWAWRVLVVTTVLVGSRSAYTLATLAFPHPPWPWSTEVALELNMPWYAVGFLAITVLGFIRALQQRITHQRLNALLPLRDALRTRLGASASATESVRSARQEGSPTTKGSIFPHEVIIEPQSSEAIRAASLPPQRALIACYTEIEDGLRQLRWLTRRSVLANVQRRVHAAGVRGRKRQRLITLAAWIACALHAVEEGPQAGETLPAGGHEDALPSHSTGNINRDLAYLARVATAFLRDPLVADIARAHKRASAASRT